MREDPNMFANEDQAKAAVAQLAKLRAPFEANQISKLPKPFKKDAEKGKCHECGGWHGLPAAHLDYVGHAALTDRLLEVDPFWTWEPLGYTADKLPLFDATGGLWIRLTVCGVSRLGYGNAEKKNGPGDREKEVIGDALRNAAMRFGAALDLWHKGDLHASANPGEDDDQRRQPRAREGRPARRADAQPEAQPASLPNEPITRAMAKRLGELMKAHDVDPAAFKAEVERRFGVSETLKISQRDYPAIEAAATAGGRFAVAAQAEDGAGA